MKDERRSHRSSFIVHPSSFIVNALATNLPMKITVGTDRRDTEQRDIQ